jgi:hypothetical protein
MDATPWSGNPKEPQAGNPFDEPANYNDQPGRTDSWPNVWPAVKLAREACPRI